MAYSNAFGRREHFGHEPPDPHPELSGWDCFELAPCSRVGGLISLISEGTATEPPLSVDTLGLAADLPTPVSSWGTAAEPPPSISTMGAAGDPSPPIHRSSRGTPDGVADSLAPTGPEDSLPSTWKGKGPCMGQWATVSISLSSRTSQSMSAATSSSSSSLPISSPRSHACCFRSHFFFWSSLVLLS